MTVFVLDNDDYKVAVVYRDGGHAAAILLPGSAVDVRKLFDDALAAS